MEAALAAFHDAYPDVSLSVDATRHPFSFDPDGETGTGASWENMLAGTPWAESVEGHHTRLDKQGAAAGIKFDYKVGFDFQPVDSQRLVLWAGAQGLQEPLVEVMSQNHFTQRKSVNEPAALLEAVAMVEGLDPDAALAMLQAPDQPFREEVLSSYR